MIEGLEVIYQQIADGVVPRVPEDWKSVMVEALYYSDSSEYFAESVSSSGKIISVYVSREVALAFDELRRKFIEAGQPLWGQASFELQSDGKFKMKWGYDDCDKNGDTIWDGDKWTLRQEERRNRLYQ